MSQDRVRFPFISSEAFVAPTDKAAMQNLQRLPLLPLVVRKYNEFAIDRLWYAENSADSVRCGPKQFSELYDMMREACAILHVPEPELYVRYYPAYNAYTAGMNRPFITLYSALIDDFTDDEILCVIGHELGHMKCGHVLYSSITDMLLPYLTKTLWQSPLALSQYALKGVFAALYEWSRQAEFSCDRAGLLVCQNPEVAFATEMKLASGSTRFNHNMSVQAFLEQAREYAESGGLDTLTKAFLFWEGNWNRTHPQSVYRAKRLDEWIQSGAYDKILRGDYIRDPTGGAQMGSQLLCPQCKIWLSTTIRFCPQCGTDLAPEASEASVPKESLRVCAKCDAVMPESAKFCMDCGESLE